MSDPTPSHWNYRVLIHNDEDGAPIYSLHECYYESGESEPSSWTEDPVGLIASDLEWLKKVLLEALDKPAIDKRPAKLTD
jgi:hypothetical protein